MNKVLMKLVTSELIKAASEVALLSALLKVEDAGVPKKVLTDGTAQKLQYIGAMRWHGLIPDEWIMASLARQYSFAVRDGHAEAEGLPSFQHNIMHLLEQAERAYADQFKKYNIDPKSQPRIGEIIGKETHDLITKVGGIH